MSTSLDKVNDILSRITYKPGWAFKVAEHVKDFPRSKMHVHTLELIASYSTTDIITRGPITLSMCLSLEPEQVNRMCNDEIIRFFIKRVIMQLETHEFEEWFKFEGKCVFDPHPELNHA